jgi:hypothetical protein
MCTRSLLASGHRGQDGAGAVAAGSALPEPFSLGHVGFVNQNVVPVPPYLTPRIYGPIVAALTSS